MRWTALFLVTMACGGAATTRPNAPVAQDTFDGSYTLDMDRTLDALREKTAAMSEDVQRLAFDMMKSTRFAMRLERDGSAAVSMTLPVLDGKSEEKQARGDWRVDAGSLVVTVDKMHLVCERKESARLVCRDKSSIYYLARGTPPESRPATALALPPLDRPWTAKDYADCAAALRADALPRVGSHAFARMVNADNLARYRDRSNARAFGEFGEFEEAAANVLRVYVNALSKDLTLASEVFALLQLFTHATALSWSLSDEFLVTLDANEPAYATRLAGIDRMRLGSGEMVSGTLTMNPPVTFWADAGADWAAVVHRLGHEARGKTLATFATLERQATDDATRTALASTRRALMGLPAADFVVAKDGSFTPRNVTTPRDVHATIEVDDHAPASDAIKLVSRVREAGARIITLRLANDARRLVLTPPRVERSGSPDDLALTAIVVRDGISLKTHGGNIAPGCSIGAGLVAPNGKDGSRDTEALGACATKLKLAVPRAHSLTIVATANTRFADVVAVADALDAFSDVRLATSK